MKNSPFAPSGHFSTPSLEQWQTLARAALRGRPLERLNVHTREGITLSPLYTSTTSAPAQPPGVPPFTRGTEAPCATHKAWRICQHHSAFAPGFGSDALRCDIAQGVESIRAPFFSDEGDVNALDQLFNGVDPGALEIHLDAGADGCAAAATLAAFARHRSIPFEQLRGAVEVDPLGVLAREGSTFAALDAHWEALASLIRWLEHQRSPLRCVSISLDAHHNAGADAATELACMLASTVETLRALSKHGISVQQACERLLVRFSVGSDFFMEIAKLRAARALFSLVIARCSGDEAAQKLTLHARTSARSFATRDPWVNVLRATLAGFAAIAGGAQTLHVAPLDEALETQTPFGRRLARNVHLILREESQLDRVLDPAGGSYYVESLTQTLTQQAWTRFQEIEANGGLARDLAEGTLARRIEACAERRRKDIATRRLPLIGVSEFAMLSQNPIPSAPPEVAPQIPARALIPREEQATKQLLERLSAAPGDLDIAVDAALAGASLREDELGEILRSRHELPRARPHSRPDETPNPSKPCGTAVIDGAPHTATPPKPSSRTSARSRSTNTAPPSRPVSSPRRASKPYPTTASRQTKTPPPRSTPRALHSSSSARATPATRQTPPSSLKRSSTAARSVSCSPAPATPTRTPSVTPASTSSYTSASMPSLP